jgi:hypothetical protein
MPRKGRLSSAMRSTMKVTMKRKPTTKRTGAAPADKVDTKAGENGDVELKEDELKKVSGGLIALLGDHK